MNRLVLAAVWLTTLVACSGAPSGSLAPSGGAQSYWLSLSVSLQFDPNVIHAALDYRDACLQQWAFPIADRLQEALTREIGTVFVHVQSSALQQPRPFDGEQTDGVVDVTLVLKELDLVIPRHDTNAYAATVTLGTTVRYTDAGGAVLSGKSLRTSVRGEVETDTQGCEVNGLADVAQQAITALAQAVKKHLGTSVRIRQAAEARAQGKPRPLP